MVGGVLPMQCTTGQLSARLRVLSTYVCGRVVTHALSSECSCAAVSMIVLQLSPAGAPPVGDVARESNLHVLPTYRLTSSHTFRVALVCLDHPDGHAVAAPPTSSPMDMQW